MPFSNRRIYIYFNQPFSELMSPDTMRLFWFLWLFFYWRIVDAQPQRYYKEGKVSYITEKGDSMARYFDAGSEFSEGYAVVVEKGQRFFLNTSLQQAFGQSFEEASPFREGYACVRSKGLFGYIQPNGEWALEPRFEQAASFCGGVAKVKMQGSWYLISPQGKKITEQGFEQVADWNEFPIAVCLNQTWGYINAKGGWVIAPKFKQAYPFHHRRAVVQLGNKQYLITRRGKIKKEIEEEDDDEIKKQQ